MPEEIQKEIIEMPDGRLLFSFTFVEDTVPVSPSETSESPQDQTGDEVV